MILLEYISRDISGRDAYWRPWNDTMMYVFSITDNCLFSSLLISVVKWHNIIAEFEQITIVLRYVCSTREILGWSRDQDNAFGHNQPTLDTSQDIERERERE